MERREFEARTKLFYDELNERENVLGIRFIVRESKNEFWVWNSNAMVQLNEDEFNPDRLIAFSSVGGPFASGDDAEVFEFVFGTFDGGA